MTNSNAPGHQCKGEILALMMPSFEEPRASSYPRPPWDLKGTACLSIWRVPADDVPVRGPGIRPATLFGQCLVGTAWARYEPGGTLVYKELAAATAGLVGLRPVITIHDIWVDNTAAVLAGRELWENRSSSPGSMCAQTPFSRLLRRVTDRPLPRCGSLPGSCCQGGGPSDSPSHNPALTDRRSRVLVSAVGSNSDARSGPLLPMGPSRGLPDAGLSRASD
jgi:hypothetical protein